MANYQSQLDSIGRQRDFTQSLLAQNLAPQQNQNALTGIARVLAAYMGSKNLKGLDTQEQELTKQREDERRSELSRVLMAGQGLNMPVDTSGNELAGPPSQGPGGREALVQALSQSKIPDFQEMALKAQLPMSKPTDAPSNVREWEFFSKLPPEAQSDYLNMKRSGFGAGGVQYTAGGEQIVDTDKIAGDAGAIEGGKQAGKAAIDQSTKAFEQMPSVRKNIANYDEAIRLIDEGAETGVVAARLPSVREASIQLDNMQSQLGLDVIGNTTFGALSEAELKFALDSALPTNLEGPALKEWLTRKRDAQAKLLNYLEGAATFLGTPGNTVADFIKMQKGQSEPANGGGIEFLGFEE